MYLLSALLSLEEIRQPESELLSWRTMFSEDLTSITSIRYVRLKPISKFSPQ